MRFASAFLGFAVLWAGGAEASSFVVLPPMTGDLGPSMVALGQTTTPDVTVLAAMPEPSHPLIAEPGQMDIVSPSIVALGEPAVTDESVAAIGTETKKPRPNTTLMVIRGGVVGDAFSSAATSAPVTVQPGAEPQAAAQEPTSGNAAQPESAPAAAAPGPVTKPQ
jgi:hypothetical protein